MQQPAVPELAHTHTRPIHWVATAAALAAVVAGSSFVQPDAATAVQKDGPEAVAQRAPGPAPDAADVTFPIDCGPVRAVVVRTAAGDLDGDGTPETVAVVRCDSSMGTPPNGVYVITRSTRPDTAPRVVATLVAPKDRLNVMDLAIRGSAVAATLLGYSSSGIPNCCPDERRRTTWKWRDGHFIASDPADARSV
ncbi:hypothetical protein ACIQXD_16720 [Streptomyces uncialis]|uniref:hypothetical protein n=1 Tax=Streptomyces uncialis TaxID=1048205 RepID=UPI0037F90916